MCLESVGENARAQLIRISRLVLQQNKAVADIRGGLAVGNDHGITVVAAKPAPTKPVRVSAGVSAGLLVQPIRPVYPGIAKAAHMEGAVVIEAIISKSGQIESAHVISGPAMLQSAALEAVRAARYSPYRLNGEATDVETTITINFRLGS